MGAEGWGWDANSKTLTLDGLNLNVAGADAAIIIPANSKIVLAGDNTVSCAGPAPGSYYGYGLLCVGGGTLTIEGGGTLSLHGDMPGQAWWCPSAGLYGDDIAITIKGSASVTLSANHADSYADGAAHGIYTVNGISIIIEDKAELVLKGKKGVIHGTATLTYPSGYEIKGWTGSDYTVDVTHSSGKVSFLV